jgi:hypothetical protein
MNEHPATCHNDKETIEMSTASVTEFRTFPVNKASIVKRKPVHGVGINDADYLVAPRVNGGILMCPYYSAWTGMLDRCYRVDEHKRHPTYIGCSVVKEWHTFSVFRAWMQQQDWQGKELDKDILVPGNKVYSPSTCYFVTRAMNILLNDRRAARGDWPRGVYLIKETNKFRAHISCFGKWKHLGVFDTPEKAETAYKKGKSDYIRSVAATEAEPIRSALFKHADLFYKKGATPCGMKPL